MVVPPSVERMISTDPTHVPASASITARPTTGVNGPATVELLAVPVSAVCAVCCVFTGTGEEIVLLIVTPPLTASGAALELATVTLPETGNG